MVFASSSVHFASSSMLYSGNEMFSPKIITLIR
jgi:hypothetical protein